MYELVYFPWSLAEGTKTIVDSLVVVPREQRQSLTGRRSPRSLSKCAAIDFVAYRLRSVFAYATMTSFADWSLDINKIPLEPTDHLYTFLIHNRDRIVTRC